MKLLANEEERRRNERVSLKDCSLTIRIFLPTRRVSYLVLSEEIYHSTSPLVFFLSLPSVSLLSFSRSSLSFLRKKFLFGEHEVIMQHEFLP